MESQKYEVIKQSVQTVIDLIAQKNYSKANLTLSEAGELLDEILDHSADDADLIEISRYQVLLNQLQLKIRAETNSK